LVYKIKVSVHGFVNGKNILTNATNHSNRKVILNIDLKDFFTQIHFGRVRGMLSKKPYNIGIEAATVISQLACYNGVLPQGAPSSPIITNMICSPLDTQFTKIAFKNNVKYTRYADDLTFSGLNPQVVSKISSRIEDIVNNEGFEINKDKTRIAGSSRAKTVTGLVLSKDSFGIGKNKYKLLRAKLHHLTKKSEQKNLELLSHVDGYLAFLKSVDKNRFQRVRKYIDTLIEKYPTTLIKNLKIE